MADVLPSESDLQSSLQLGDDLLIGDGSAGLVVVDHLRFLIHSLYTSQAEDTYNTVMYSRKGQLLHFSLTKTSPDLQNQIDFSSFPKAINDFREFKESIPTVTNEH